MTGHRGRPRKLTDAQAADVREWYRQWLAIPKPIDKARQYGVNPTTLHAIATGLAYKTPSRK